MHKTNFKRIIAASILIFNEPIIVIFGNEPSVKYKDTAHHPFHQKIVSVISDTNNSMETFRKWQNEVIGGFNQNIWLVLNF